MITRYIPYLEGQHKKLQSYKRFVIWGLLNEKDTFRYIYEHYFRTLKALEIDVLWLDNKDPRSVGMVKKGDVVFCADRGAENLPFKKDVDYILHNIDDSVIDGRLDPKNFVHLQVYTKGAEVRNQAWNESTYFNKKKQLLYQPWGTDLLPDQFYKPVHPRGKFVFWVGSIWDNEEKQGNIRVITDFKKHARSHRLLFMNPKNVSDRTNIRLVRHSRIAPSLAGEWQAENEYLPCRFFKNVSYGQLGITNVPKFRDVVGQDLFFKLDPRSPQQLEKLLALSPAVYKDSVLAQQEYIRRRHTYVSKIANLMRALEEVR